MAGGRAWVESWAYPARSDRNTNECRGLSLYSCYRCLNSQRCLHRSFDQGGIARPVGGRPERHESGTEVIDRHGGMLVRVGVDADDHLDGWPVSRDAVRAGYKNLLE